MVADIITHVHWQRNKMIHENNKKKINLMNTENLNNSPCTLTNCCRYQFQSISLPQIQFGRHPTIQITKRPLIFLCDPFRNESVLIIYATGIIIEKCELPSFGSIKCQWYQHTFHFTILPHDMYRLLPLNKYSLKKNDVKCGDMTASVDLPKY